MSSFFLSIYFALQSTLRTSRPDPRNRLGLRLRTRIVLMAAGLGVAADLLFNGAQLGINVPLWFGGLIGALLIAGRRGARSMGRLPVVSLSIALVAAAMVAWRASGTLHAALLTTVIGFIALGLVIRPGFQARGMGLAYLLASLLVGVVSILAGTIRLLRDTSWREFLGRDLRSRLHSVGRAMLLTAPLLLIFGALFVAADAVFESRLKDALSIDVQAAAGHAAWFAGGFVAACGVLWSGLAGDPPELAQPSLPETRRLRAVETAIILGSLSGLFVVFVAIQIRYLFGGESLVQESIGLTYADYARRGFFELVIVAGLVLPVLLAVDWARRRDRHTTLLSRVLTAALVALLLVIMASAIARLGIYVQEFGLTELRLYAALFLGWLAVVSLWLVWSLLRDRRDAFVWGAAGIAIIALVAAVAANPDAIIAGTNVQRADEGRAFDPVHAAGLSADAVPRLVAGLDELTRDDACFLAQSLVRDWAGDSDGFRSWNWGRRSARHSVNANVTQLSAACE